MKTALKFMLINVPIREDEQPENFPTGLGIITSVLLNSGYEVEVLDADGYRLSFEEIIRQVDESNADVICLSGLISTYAYQYRLIHEIKKRKSSVPVISGGGCATSIPKLMMEHTPVDILVLGEGEHTIKELAAALEHSDSLKDIKGIAYRLQNGKDFKINEARPIEPNLDVFPLPAYHLFPMDIYVANPIWHCQEPSINIISSRGCPMDCYFCYNIFGRRSYRKRSASSIIEEIRMLKKNYGIGFFGFVDDNLTVNKAHLAAVCDVLREEHIKWGCHGRVDTADDERLEMMARSGCVWLGFGIESGSSKILANMNKRATVEQCREAVIRTRRHGIFPNATFIHGYLGETKETIVESARLKLELGMVSKGFFATPYPGTKLYDQAISMGRIQNEHEFAMSLNNAYDFRVNLTEMSDEELIYLRDRTDYELQMAVGFQVYEATPKNETGFLSFASELLGQDFVVEEAKGYILAGLAKHFAKKGDSNMARRTILKAREYGVTIANDEACLS